MNLIRFIGMIGCVFFNLIIICELIEGRFLVLFLNKVVVEGNVILFFFLLFLSFLLLIFDGICLFSIIFKDLFLNMFGFFLIVLVFNRFELILFINLRVFFVVFLF